MDGQLEPAVQATVNVDTSSVEVIAYGANRRRVVWYLKNTSPGTQTISLGFGVPAVAGVGIVLAKGETVNDSEVMQYLAYQGTINAIADAAGGTLAVFARYA